MHKSSNEGKSDFVDKVVRSSACQWLAESNFSPTDLLQWLDSLVF